MVTRRFIMQRHAVTDCSAPTACRRMVSGTISLFLSKFFSPFPHGTGSLSVSQEYLALPDGPGRFAQNSSCSALLRIPLCRIQLHIQGYHLLWLNFPEHSIHCFLYNHVVPTTPAVRCHITGLGCSPFARHYWGIIIYFLFLRVLRCFSSLG